MKNDELKALYEEFPWAFDRYERTKTTHWRGPLDNMNWFGCMMYRLKPRLPADLPEPTEDMMNRAVGLGYGPIEAREGVTFLGWACEENGWNFGRWEGIYPGVYYYIDINDPNSREIIALNRAEAEKPFDVEVETHPVAEMVQSVFNERVQYLLSLDEQSIRDALIKLGWTPPGESEWLRLDECDVATHDGVWYALDSCDEARESACIYAVKHGPASVRVRKKRSNP